MKEFIKCLCLGRSVSLLVILHHGTRYPGSRITHSCLFYFTARSKHRNLHQETSSITNVARPLNHSSAFPIRYFYNLQLPISTLYSYDLVWRNKLSIDLSFSITTHIESNAKSCSALQYNEIHGTAIIYSETNFFRFYTSNVIFSRVNSDYSSSCTKVSGNKVNSS